MTGQNDRPDESLTGQVHDQAGHCPLTGRYFEPWKELNNLASGVERGGGGRRNLRFSPSLSLPFLALATQAIGPLWLLSSCLFFRGEGFSIDQLFN